MLSQAGVTTRNSEAFSRILASAYLEAKEYVVSAGFADEIDWQSDLDLWRIQESDLLREGAWVVLCCGMRESVVRGVFDRVSTAYLNWRSASAIVHDRETCRELALEAFKHPGKIDAILTMAERVATETFEQVMSRIVDEGLEYLRSFPFIGPVSACHLAKNLGLQVVKPDRHLVRIARVTGVGSVVNLCDTIAGIVGDKLAVVDLVLWRFATLRRDYLDFFSSSHDRHTCVPPS